MAVPFCSAIDETRRSFGNPRRSNGQPQRPFAEVPSIRYRTARRRRVPLRHTCISHSVPSRAVNVDQRCSIHVLCRCCRRRGRSSAPSEDVAAEDKIDGVHRCRDRGKPSSPSARPLPIVVIEQHLLNTDERRPVRSGVTLHCTPVAVCCRLLLLP